MSDRQGIARETKDSKVNLNQYFARLNDTHFGLSGCWEQNIWRANWKRISRKLRKIIQNSDCLWLVTCSACPIPFLRTHIIQTMTKFSNNLKILSRRGWASFLTGKGKGSDNDIKTITVPPSDLSFRYFSEKGKLSPKNFKGC